MERLTEWRGDHAFMTKDCEKAIDKLARYEDAEEQGRLIVLPRKVGDTVYSIKKKNVRREKNVEREMFVLK